jgi:hypothetical protein
MVSVVSVYASVIALLAISGCASEREWDSRVDRMNSEEWYLEDAVQRGLPGGPRESTDDQDEQPIVETEEAEQDSVRPSSDESP